MARKNEVEVLVTAKINEYEAAMREAAEKAKQLGKALKESDKNANTFSGNMRRLASNLSVMRGPLDGVAGRVNAVATLMERTSLVGAGATIAISTLAAAFAYATREAYKSELTMARMDGVIRATGQAAGLTTEDLESMAQRISYATLASTDEIRNASAQLLTFKSVGSDAFERVLYASQDLAETGFGSVESSAVALGKAIENPTIGLAALREKGISFTDAQRDMIIDMVRLGDESKAAATLLEIVESQVGGVAKTVADTTAAGKLDTLTQQFSELAREISKSSGALTAFKAMLDLTSAAVKATTAAVSNSDEAQLRRANERLQLLFQNQATAQAAIDRFNKKGDNRSIGYSEAVTRLKGANDAVEKALNERNGIQERLDREQRRKINEGFVAASKAEDQRRERQRLAANQLQKDRDEILDGSRQFVNEQIEISKQGGFGAGGGDPRAAEAARYAAAQGRARAQMEKDMAKDRLDDDSAIRKEYEALEVQQKAEHLQRLRAIDIKEAEERRKALEEQMKRDFGLRQSVLDSQARTAGAAGDWKRELELQKQAAAERAVFEYEQAVARGESEIEVRKRMLEELLAVEAEFIEKKNDIYQRAFEKEFKRQQDEELAMRDLRISGYAAIGQSAGNLRDLLAEQQGAGFEAYKAMAIAQAGIAAALAQLSVLQDMTIPWWAKPPLMATMAALSVAQMGKIYSSKAPGRAAGGPVTAGMPYTVGEMGRELFVPSTHGSIVSNSKMGGIGGNTTVNIIESQERGGQTEEAEDGSLNIFVAAVKASVMRDIQRGTGIGSMVQRRGYR